MPAPHPQSSRLQRLIQQTVGPTPWYWETFPELRGPAGQLFTWKYHGSEGQLAYLVTLNLRPEPDVPRLALNSYCRPFAVDPHRLGIWCPEGRHIRFVLFELAQFKTFSYDDIVGWFKPSNERIYCATAPIAEFEIPSVLPPGTQPIRVPAGFQDVKELLIATSYPAKTKDGPAAAVYVVYPHAGLVEVLPQRWFTARQYDVGMQWITRVTRDPSTHRIIGEGFRIGNFELTDDGCEIAAMIES